jgi:hypothetical protein
LWTLSTTTQGATNGQSIHPRFRTQK